MSAGGRPRGRSEDPSDQDLQAAATALVAVLDDGPDFGVERRQRPQPAHGEAVDGPEPGETFNELPETPMGVGLAEGGFELEEAAVDRHRIADGFEQPGFGLELVVNRGSGYVSLFRHGIDGEIGIARRPGQKAPSRGDHTLADLIDLLLALPELVGTRAHSCRPILFRRSIRRTI